MSETEVMLAIVIPSVFIVVLLILAYTYKTAIDNHESRLDALEKK